MTVLAGKALDVERQDLKDAMHLGIKTLYDSDNQMSQPRTGNDDCGGVWQVNRGINVLFDPCGVNMRVCV